MDEIDFYKLIKLQREGALIIDVRSPQEYTENHIEGAINIPVYLILKRINEIGNVNRKIIVYCSSGMRSKKAKKILNQNGFMYVYNLNRY